jgi:hypothetical protein
MPAASVAREQSRDSCGLAVLARALHRRGAANLGEYRQGLTGRGDVMDSNQIGTTLGCKNRSNG